MSASAAELVAGLRAYGLTFELAPGYDDRRHEAAGRFEPGYVVDHHTAGPKISSTAKDQAPSLGWMLAPRDKNGNRYQAPGGGFVRGCHFLIGRDGTVHFVYAYGCYHAGEGGPYGSVGRDAMNHYAYGIEVESQGLRKDFTAAQRIALGKLNAMLLAVAAKALGMPNPLPVSRVINHRTWAPTRKVDTRYSDRYLRLLTTRAIEARTVTVLKVKVKFVPGTWVRETASSKGAHAAFRATGRTIELSGLISPDGKFGQTTALNWVQLDRTTYKPPARG